MNIDIDKELVVICEGRADNLFLKQLIKERGEHKAFAPIQFLKDDELKGKGSFKRLLKVSLHFLI